MDRQKCLRATQHLNVIQCRIVFPLALRWFDFGADPADALAAGSTPKTPDAVVQSFAVKVLPVGAHYVQIVGCRVVAVLQFVLYSQLV